MCIRVLAHSQLSPNAIILTTVNAFQKLAIQL